ncbi:MAG TPA: hypothetical protein PLO24_07015 [Bacteroidales bacterium]|jgi:regulator of replication initiation timing|nr:hypothetical protein [Bacteroidales bacterium]HOS71631.1 hypothetical protein [Bacteroidales bacterium]HQH24227.1 hypothetical protein [Bacteroidales bacterium]HQJ83541.1 hypothetical protein [Bacteroidales bacterium]
MKNKMLMGFAVIVMIGILAGCGKVPQAQIDATNAAIEAARTVQADIYLPDEFAAIQDSMNAILVNIELQKSKLFKNFGDEKDRLDQVTNMANQTAARVDAKKEEVKQEVQNLLNDTRNVVAENSRLVTRLPRGKEGAQVIEQIKADLSGVENSVSEAQNLFDKGAFMDALNRVKAARAKADGLNSEMKEVLTKARIRF